MVKVESFYITLDNPLATYYSGQAVSGKVNLRLDKDLNHKGIFVCFQGAATVRWTEQHSRYNASTKRSETVTVTKSDSQTYFNFEFALLPIMASDDRMTLQAGNYEYPFSYVLPVDLPTSMEGAYGRIRYTCSSYISRPWRFNSRCKAAFTVLEMVDLNRLPGIGNPCNSESRQPLRICCIPTGSISAAISINKQGYVPGETITINANVNNTTSRKIKITKASLICVITYRVDTSSRMEKVVINSVKHGLIQPQSTDNYVDERIPIPAIYPTRVGAGLCRLISWEYFIEFTVVPALIVSRNLEFIIPVTIGSVPLTNDFAMFTQSPASDYPYSEIGFRPTIFNEYPNLPPPSYEESFSGKVDIREEDDAHTMGDLSFVPHYLYYNQLPPPPYSPAPN